MNEILTTILQYVGALGWIIPTFLSVWLFRHSKNELLSYADEAREELHEYMVKAKNFYATEKADFVNSLPQLVGNFLGTSNRMSELGQASGISRQLKGLERDMIADGIDAVSPIPGIGGLAAKYMQKYPILAQILPQLLAKYQGSNQPQAQPQNNTW